MFVRVGVPVPQLDLLTYRVPADLAVPAVGARVVVPLGSRLVTGVVVEATATLEGGRDGAEPATSEMRDIARVLDETAFIPADIVDLARWTADYYMAGAGATLTTVLPPKTRGTRADAHKTERVASITDAGRLALAGVDAAAPVRLKGSSAKALALLAESPNGLSSAALARAGVRTAGITGLAKRGLVAFRHERVARDPFDAYIEMAGEDDRVLTGDQDRALRTLESFVAPGAFKVALLHGVTGSGKTEVYLRLARRVRAMGRGVLVLVPEIALTPAIAAAFRNAFGDRVAIQHSGLSDGERHDQWQKIRRHEIDAVVGTRSAVFAPLEDPGLIIVDEEHDSAYKQDESPRYHARDVAVLRGQRAGALVVLGSATPSIESYHHAMNGKYEHVTLEQRVLSRPLAAVSIVDMRDEYATEGPDVVLSRSLVAGLEERVTRGEQALVLLNRRGFATAVFCRQCGGTMECPNCSVSLVVHGSGRSRRARCHYCNLAIPVPAACVTCAAPYLELSGFGTQRVEAEVLRVCPGARVARLDRDAVAKKGALASLLQRFRSGEIDVLIGTQMIAKGHDFPRVTLVGVVSADVGLGMADFRAAERTFQLLTQVAGRAGRGEQAGEAIIQTLYPTHYSIRFACLQDYPGFYAHELKFREAMRYPPTVALTNIIVRAPSLAEAMKDAGDLAAGIEAGGAGLSVLGPAPAPLVRIRGQFRAQMIIKSANRRRMREAVRQALARRPQLARRTTVDVDPVSVL